METVGLDTEGLSAWIVAPPLLVAPFVSSTADNSGRAQPSETMATPASSQKSTGQRPSRDSRIADSQAQSASSTLVTRSTMKALVGDQGLVAVSTTVTARATGMPQGSSQPAQPRTAATSRFPCLRAATPHGTVETGARALTPNPGHGLCGLGQLRRSDPSEACSSHASG